MWGYGVDPPADINPHLGLVSRMSVGLKLAFVAQVASSGLRSSQVLFDRSPTSGPSREVHERSTAGTSQVSKKPTGTGAAPASWKQAYPWPVVAFCSPPADKTGAACCPTWSAQNDTPISAAFTRLTVIPLAMRGPDPRPTSDLPGAWRALHRGRRAIEIPEQAVR